MCVFSGIRELVGIYKNPVYKALDARRVKDQFEVLRLVEDIEHLVESLCLSGEEGVNGLGERHFLECPQAVVGGDCLDTCFCGLIERKHTDVMGLLERLKPIGRFERFKRWLGRGEVSSLDGVDR